MKDFGEWKPDDVPFNLDGLLTCENVLPGDLNYLPIPAPTELSTNALSENVIGGIAVRNIENNGVTFNFVGTLTALYRIEESAFSDVSKAGGYNGQNEDDRWEFAQVGNDIIATNFQDAIQSYTIGSSSLLLIWQVPHHVLDILAGLVIF